jgi:hypothetical protein
MDTIQLKDIGQMQNIPDGSAICKKKEKKKKRNNFH